MYISLEEVIKLHTLLTTHGIKLWLTGGWGIDALLGRETRQHHDLDVIMLNDDVICLQNLMADAGYSLKMLWEENRPIVDAQGNQIPTAFVLQDADGREFDAHAMHFNEEGIGIPDWLADEGSVFTPQDLSGIGAIAGFEVCCLSPEKQMRVHTGYELPERQIPDIDLMHEKFGLFPQGSETNPAKNK